MLNCIEFRLLKGGVKTFPPTNSYFSLESRNRVYKMQSYLAARIIMGPYVKLPADAPGGADICSDWLSEAASEVSDSI